MDTMKRIFTAVAGIVVFTMGTVVVKPARAVPESNSSLSLLAFGVAGLLLKGKIDKKTQTVSAVISQ